MKVQGACHCSRIRYAAEVDPARVSICHCTDCQILTGSAYRVSVPTSAEDFKLLAGTPKVYIKTAASGNKRAQAFCGECGAPIYATDATLARVLFLRVGNLQERAQLAPRRQIWFRSALPWAQDIHAVESIERE